jgi:predicted aspartyl protease
VRNLAGQEHHQTEELIQIDTGYSEELLIPQVLFEALNLARWQLPDSIAAQGTTITGQIIKFDEAPVDVIIPKTGEQHRVMAQTFAGNIRFLIGRAFLRRFKVLLGGPGSQTCFLIPDSS